MAKSVTPPSGAGAAALPGAPEWVTPELLQRTIEVWQPRYESTLTDDDALEILLTVARLFDRE